MISVADKQRLFPRVIAPIVLRTSGLIEEDRTRAKKITERLSLGQSVSPEDQAWLAELAVRCKRGITIAGEDHPNRTEFLFTHLNDLKPGMIEEATRNAREVAQKFSQDSGSSLGRIRKASQGQFSIEDRDSNTPHIKKVRVVSTVEYCLSD